MHSNHHRWYAGSQSLPSSWHLPSSLASFDTLFFPLQLPHLLRFLERARCAGPTNAAAGAAFCPELLAQQVLLTRWGVISAQSFCHFYSTSTTSLPSQLLFPHFYSTLFFLSLIKAPISELHIFSLSSALSFPPASLLPVILHPHSAIYSEERLLFCAASAPCSCSSLHPQRSWKREWLNFTLFPLHCPLKRSITSFLKSSQY